MPARSSSTPAPSASISSAKHGETDCLGLEASPARTDLMQMRPNSALPVIDPFGRSISYLRVSVTDRCDLRCVYCMSEEMTFLPRAEVLTLEEMTRLCRVFIRLGVRKLRITGGEPLVRRDVMTLFRNLGSQLGRGLE